MKGAERGDGEEPDEHDRTKEAADASGAVVLDGEEAGEDEAGEWNYPGSEEVTGIGESFDGAENRDGRSDDAVAVE